MKYWQARMVKQRDTITNTNINRINKEMRKYYSSAMNKVMESFVDTYNKILEGANNGEVVVADLYKLDRYWQLQAQLQAELTKLGDNQAAALSVGFTKQYKEVYDNLALPSKATYSTISTENARQMINSVWCADGKNWSSRVWNNTAALQETLNEGLVNAVITGAKTSDLKAIIRERFNASFYRANTLVNTEMAHIETQASKQKYKDNGIKKYEFIGRSDGDCDCADLDGQIFNIDDGIEGENLPPIHPNCRCCIAPVVE